MLPSHADGGELVAAGLYFVSTLFGRGGAGLIMSGKTFLLQITATAVMVRFGWCDDSHILQRQPGQCPAGGWRIWFLLQPAWLRRHPASQKFSYPQGRECTQGVHRYQPLPLTPWGTIHQGGAGGTLSSLSDGGQQGDGEGGG